MTPPKEHVHDQPVLTRPYNEPSRHWKTEGGLTSDEIVPERRTADEPLPMGQAIPLQRDLALDTIRVDGGMIDKLRREVRDWRLEGWPGTSNATRELLEYWSREPGEGPVYSLFFAQREAIETVVFLTELGNGSHWMVRHLKEVAEGWNQGLVRLALRMATGTGKTTVMACLIAWYAVNRRREHRGDARGLAKNVGRVVVICPGRPIRDRLAGLNPRAKQ
ncbi:MAG: DEAD/DEAH box helicase family protein, partial [Rhodospirillales bacterium]|nr:DEAD/DEAH box helicase family protein [Rhodospirillales bacterium]